MRGIASFTLILGLLGLSLFGCQKQSKVSAEFGENPAIAEQKAQASGDILENCIRWFDGCNDCEVSDGKILGCTEKACFVMEDPKCLVFKEQ